MTAVILFYRKKKEHKHEGGGEPITAARADSFITKAEQETREKRNMVPQYTCGT